MNGTDDRLSPVMAIITSLAQGDLHPEFPAIEGDPDLQAVVLGLQVLAKELVASRAEVEGRAAELEILNNGLLRLANLGNLLQSCDTSGEALRCPRPSCSRDVRPALGCRVLIRRVAQPSR